MLFIKRRLILKQNSCKVTTELSITVVAFAAFYAPLSYTADYIGVKSEAEVHVNKGVYYWAESSTHQDQGVLGYSCNYPMFLCDIRRDIVV